MKKIGFGYALFCGLALFATSVSAQQSVTAANKQTNAKSPVLNHDQSANTGSRARILGNGGKAIVPVTAPVPTSPINARKVSKSPAEDTYTPAARPAKDISSSDVGTNRARTVAPIGLAANAATLDVTKTIASVNGAATQHYRIGVRDVLDIQLAGQTGKQSTLFTVIDGGLLEYPLAGGPIAAAGMTTTEVAALLRQRVRTLDNPSIVVKVRDYASHPVTVTGFVAAPGVKYLRRELVPLYTVLAEALMMPEAVRATITRQGSTPIGVDLKDATQTATLVRSGDAIRVFGQPRDANEFFFVGGEISSPGQKPYHSGVTLTQAILASGGTTVRAGSKILVSRQGADGRLVTAHHNLKKIQEGKNPDPLIQKGDRLQVTRER